MNSQNQARLYRVMAEEHAPTMHKLLSTATEDDLDDFENKLVAVLMDVMLHRHNKPFFNEPAPQSATGPHSPHEQEVVNIPAEEPIFVLRARDALAIAPVYAWIDLAERQNVNETKVMSAAECAQAMQDFQTANGNKLPD